MRFHFSPNALYQDSYGIVIVHWVFFLMFCVSPVTLECSSAIVSLQISILVEQLLTFSYCDFAVANTHRHLFCNFYSSIFQDSVRDLLKEGTRPVASELLFEQMIRDILDGGECKSDIQKASYALGYNLGIEYLAQLEKGAMLESFRELDRVIFSGAGLSVDWEFLEIHALGKTRLLPALALLALVHSHSEKGSVSYIEAHSLPMGISF